MRTTLNIDEDLLVAAKELAKRKRITTVKCISVLVRVALTTRSRALKSAGQGAEVFGFIAIPAGGELVTDTLVNELREELGA